MKASSLLGGLCCALASVSACTSKDVVLFGADGASGAGAGAIAGTASASAGMPGTAGMGGSSTAAGTAGMGGGDTGAASATGGDTGAANMTGDDGGQSEGGASAAPITCANGSDCPEGWGCEKSSCSAATGSCIPHPLCFDVTPNLVCGCDGVTYWNDCLRKQIGPAASTPGECEAGAKRCWMSPDCGSGLQCGHLFLPNDVQGDMCGPGPVGGRNPIGNQPGMQPSGTCWALPDTCDASVDPLRWDECQGPDAHTCMDTCSALRSSSNGPYVKNTSGSCP